MLYNILKENRYLFPFLIQKNIVTKNGKSTINKEIIINSFNNLFDTIVEDDRKHIFNTNDIINKVKSNKMLGLNELEYILFFLLGQKHSNKYYVHREILKDTYFLKNGICISSKKINSTIDNETNIYCIEESFKPFFIFSFNFNYYIFIQSGLSQELQKNVYLFIKETFLFNKKYNDIHFIPFNFNNEWTQLLFNFIETFDSIDNRDIETETNILSPYSIDKSNPTLKKLI